MILSRLLGIGLAVTLTGAAHAHFIWATLSPDRSTLRVQFAERPGDSVLADFAGKAATTKGFAGPNQPVELKQESDDRLLASKLPSPRGVAGADLIYGVTNRGGAAVYLLHYHAKAAADIAASAESVGFPVELFLKSANAGTVITVRNAGKAAPGTEVVIYPETGDEIEATANAQGEVIVPAAVKVADVRAMVPEKAKGTYEGKTYELVHHYATLSVGTSRSTLPADPAAYKLLENAAVKRQNFPTDLKGLSGKFVYDKDGEQVHADFKYTPADGLTIATSGVPEEATGAVESLLGHRRARPFAEGDGRRPMSFTGKDDAIGKQIALHDSMKSFYRVHNDSITEVDRTMGGQRLVITVLSEKTTPQGKSLPHVIAVTYFDPKSGAVVKTEFITDEYVEVQGVWVPTLRKSTVAEKGKFTTTTIRFEDWQVLR
ncbi:DUF3386 family protein [bacterium]|nr:MAG: DUF3386 family protein [bacterium]